jgi:S1-C subfamily serine protease
MRRSAATIALLGGAVFVSLAVPGAQAGTPSAKTARASPPPVVANPAQIDFAAMVERYGPAVVNISPLGPSTPGIQGMQSDPPDPQSGTLGLDNLDPDDPMFALFRAASAPPTTQSTVPDPPRVVWGTGSGFIVSPDGMVVTTAHIVNRAEQVTVTLTDRRRFKATVLGVDPQTDVALLQIEGGNKLPAIRLGDASRVRVGERVLALGSPDGPQNAATSGLVSVTPHALPDGNAFTFLETDIAADPDNSGGPLLDRTGAAIGVNVQVYADTGRYRTMTLAIPIDAAIKLRTQLQGQGKVAGGSLDAQVQDVDPGLAAAFGLPHAAGALVTAVASTGRHGGVANGLKPGDVITRINGKPVEHQADLTDYVSALQPGSKVALAVIRNKKPMAVTVVVVPRADGGSAAMATTLPGGSGQKNVIERLGLSVHALSDDERRSSGLPYGVMVDAAEGTAANAGIQGGDVVLSVNSEAVSTRDQFESLLARSGKEVALLVQRDNARTFVSLEVK